MSSDGGLTDSRQRRSYVFVSFDGAALDPDCFAEPLMSLTSFSYCIFQLELCPTTGNPHYQGFLQFINGTRPSTINAALPYNISLRVRRGSVAQAIAYCSKEDTRLDGPFEYGRRPVSGQRSDLIHIAQKAIGCTNLGLLVREDPTIFMRYSRGIQAIMAATAPPRTEPPVVVLLYGPPGTGKTRMIYDNFPLESIYVKQTDDTFFDGYTGQDVFVLDDFAGRASRMTLKYLLILLDRYPVRLPIKGSSTQLLATKIYLTTNVHPRLWYDYSDRSGEMDCLKRRVHQVVWFKNSSSAVHLHRDKFFDDWTPGCDESRVFRSLFPPSIPGNQDAVDLDSPLGSPDHPITL